MDASWYCPRETWLNGSGSFSSSQTWFCFNSHPWNVNVKFVIFYKEYDRLIYTLVGFHGNIQSLAQSCGFVEGCVYVLRYLRAFILSSASEAYDIHAQKVVKKRDEFWLPFKVCMKKLWPTNYFLFFSFSSLSLFFPPHLNLPWNDVALCDIAVSVISQKHDEISMKDNETFKLYEK